MAIHTKITSFKIDIFTNGDEVYMLDDVLYNFECRFIENKDENYDFSLSKLGRDIKTSIERFMFPERFTLSPSVITNKTLLENDKNQNLVK
jgi:hypothetical protein